MQIDLKDVLNAAGPTTSLLFASWIFLGYLNARLTEAQKRFNDLVQEFREHGDRDARHRSLYEQIGQNRERCILMCRATDDALYAAYFLFGTIAAGITSIAIQQPMWLSLTSLACALAGLVLLAKAVMCALAENQQVRRSIQSEVHDVPEFSADKKS